MSEGALQIVQRSSVQNSQKHPVGRRRAGSSLLGVAVALLASNASTPVLAQVAASQSVVVTATRTPQDAFNLPAAIDRVEGTDVRDAKWQVNLSEALSASPGLQARDRQNYAQDVQISVRGFGARSTFGIRGVRLYVDGIPATLPDGQGQLSNVDLSSIDRIEVLRGPFSALYGNSSGGVIQTFTEDGTGPATVTSSLSAGSDGARRLGLKVAGSSGDYSYLGSASRFETDGYRQHSEAGRTVANAKLVWRGGDLGKLSLIVNSAALPEAQDPLGLTRAQLGADPRGVDPSAIAFDTRKTFDQTQGGLIHELRLGDKDAIRYLVYTGHRNTEQFQSIPVATQASPLHPGGVILLTRDYRGADLRWIHEDTSWFGGPASVVVGLSGDALREGRVGRQNFIGSVLGVEGALRRDEDNTARNLDGYAQADWRPTARLRLSIGVRHADIRFSSRDRYIVIGNPDDSGSTRFNATLPVVGALYEATPDLHLYAASGRGFETPTLNELAYRPNGGSGLNFALQASSSRNAEVGVKARDARWGESTVALFQTQTDREIVTLSNTAGRSTFRNAGRTLRQGVEATWKLRAGDWRTQVAATRLDATYRDAFLTCTATPCASPNATIAAGNHIPGVARSSFFAGLGWQPETGWRGGLELRALSHVFVNDLNNDAAAGYSTASAFAGYVLRAGAWDLNAFARIDNLANRRYVGSVIVNEGNARYFEPGPGRTWLAGLNAAYAY